LADGATLSYLGGAITLRLHALRTKHISFDSASAELTLHTPYGGNEKKLKEQIRAWYHAEAKRLFAERLPVYADKLGVSYTSLTLSSAKTQWGSCSTEGNIRLNWRLMHFSLPLIDYVIAHELAHRVEMNHSPRFWAALESIYPQCQAARKDLRRCAEALQVMF
jgi:predicted metal-dependent hydrolase